MIREVDLVSYLPPFMADFKEVAVTLEAENPEFKIIWDAANQVLYNEFIATADEYGISRFEAILKILPSKEDTLESRRARVQARWFNAIPYTMKALISKLIALCGDNNFTITKQFDFYRLELETHLELYGQVDELEYIINTMLPCNIVVVSDNKIICDVKGLAAFAGGICITEHFFITNDSRETVVANGAAVHGAGVVNTASVIITNDFNEQFNITGTSSIGSGAVVSEIVGIKD
jgi:hypothetical protein